MSEEDPIQQDRNLALAYLDELDEETMRHAWGERSPEDRRRIVLAAIIFGRQFEEKMAENPPGPRQEEKQRFLMSLMNAAISEFAKYEGVDQSEASRFLSDVNTRDYVLEFNEVLDAYDEDDPELTLDDVFKRAIEARKEKAIRAQHWSSG